MALSDKQVGVSLSDGRTRYPQQSALSERPIVPGDVYITFPNKPHLLAVKATEWRRLTPGEKAAMRDKWLRDLPTETPSAEGARRTDNVETYDAMTMNDLKAEVRRRDLDMTGRRSKADHVSALVADDVTRRFAGTAAAGDVQDSPDVEGAADAVPGSPPDIGEG